MASPHLTLIEWEIAYVVGFDRFDQEHMNLVGLANAVIQAIHGGEPRDAVSGAITTLLERTCKHFDDEEALMSQSLFPQLQQHQAGHNQMARNLIGFGARCRQGAVDAARAYEFLLDWLLEHILQDDVYYAPYFNERRLT